MTLTERGRESRLRRLVVYRLDQGAGQISTFIRFTEPGDIAGTGLLTVDASAGEADQWLYLPALQRVRRIASDRKGGQFVGSDYYYEDLRDRRVPQDSHRTIGHEVVDGVACDILESVPTDPASSVYGKRVSWVDPARMLPMRVDFFGKAGDQPTKRWSMHRAKQIQGYWTIMDSTMADLTSGHQTRLTIDKIVYDRGLPPDLFSTRALEDEVREARHRP